MSETLHYLLAQPFELVAGHDMAVDDDGGIRTATVPAAWYRVLLAPSSGLGLEMTDPVELLGALGTALGASWTVAMTAEGHVRLTYTGTGTGEIVWTSTTLRNILGFAPGTIGPLATGANVVATYQPTHCMFAASADDEGWQAGMGPAVVEVMPDGTSYGWQSGAASQRRTITFQHLPRDATARAALGASGTQALVVQGRRTNPGGDEPAQDPPWAVHDTLATAVGLACGWTDRLPEVLAGTVTATDVVYLGATSFQATSTLSIPGYDQRRNVGPIELCWAGEEQI